MSTSGQICFMIISFIIIPFVFLLSLKKSTSLKPLDKSFSTPLKGICAIYVSLHHLALFVSTGRLLSFLMRIGFLCVSFFFLMSGYGLSISKKKKSFKLYLYRFLRIYIPYFICNFIVGILYLIFMDKGVSILDVIYKPLILFSVYKNKILWYVLVTLMLYILYYVIDKVSLFKNKELFLFLSVIIYMIICYINKIPTYYYNTVLCFPLGTIICKYNDKLKFSYKYLFSFISLFILCFTLFYFHKYENIFCILSSVSFALMMVYLSFIFEFKLKILNFYGEISYEYYLFQLPIIYIVMFNIKNDILFPILIILLTTILAYVTHLISNRFLDRIKIN